MTIEQEVDDLMLRALRGEHIIAVFTDYRTMHRMLSRCGQYGVYLVANSMLKMRSGGWIRGMAAGSDSVRLHGLLADVVYIGRAAALTSGEFRRVAYERSMRYKESRDGSKDED